MSPELKKLLKDELESIGIKIADKETIFFKISEDEFKYYHIDLDISPMLDLIEANQVNQHIRWMRELT